MTVKNLKITVDLDMMTVDEAVFIEEMGKRNEKGEPINKDASFAQLVIILEKAITVEGFDSIRQLPFSAIAQLMDALVTEIGRINEPSGPTTT